MKPPIVLPAKMPADLPGSESRHWLSALADGQADVAERACGLWRDDAAARRTWHTYHLIGDVMRSEELARSPARDAAFLAALRQRLASEPVLLAPSAAVVQVRSRQPWLMPAAVAAGFVALAGVLLVFRLGTPDAPLPAAVLAGAPGAGLTAVSGGAAAAATPLQGGGFIRDPQLDEYLRAHQAARGGVAAASPGGTLRRVDVVVPSAGVPR